MTDQDAAPGDALPDALPDAPGDSPVRHRRGVTQVLLAITVAAFALRLLMIFAVHPLCDFDAERWDDAAQYLAQPGETCMRLEGDSAYLYGQGMMVAAEHGMSDPLWWFTARVELASGKKPPGVVFVVAGLARLGLPSPDATRVAMALLGSATVLLVGRLALTLFGRSTSIVASLLVAFNPMFVTNDWRLLTETMAAFFFVVALGLIYRLWVRPTTRTALLLGASYGCIWYARAEAPLLWVSTIPPVLVTMRYVSRSVRWRAGLIVAVSSLSSIAPMVIANTLRFHQPAPLGTGGGWGLMNSSCDDAWYYEFTGSLTGSCYDPVTDLAVFSEIGYQPDTLKDDSDVDAVYQRQAMKYVTANLSRLPAVAAARFGRTLGLYAPGHTVEVDRSVEKRGQIEPVLGFGFLYLSMPFAALGAVVLWRRRLTIAPMIGTVVTLALLSGATFGLPRYRVFVDVSLVFLAAVGIVTTPSFLRHVRRRRGAEPAAGPPWWSAPAGGLGPDESISRTMARPRPPLDPRWRRVGLPAAAALLVLGVGIVAWSAGIEPVDPTSGVTTETQRQLCIHLDNFGNIIRDVGGNPAVLQRAPAELDAIARLAPPELEPEATDLRQRLESYFRATASGTTPQVPAEQVKAASQSAQHILELRNRIC